MSDQRRPTTYLSLEELTQIAAAKLDAAAALPPSPKKDALLRSAGKYRKLAVIKGWLNSELRPPE